MNIEDYAVIGDMHSLALVGSDGSLDWLCLPRFDSGAVFASLLGGRDNGRWKLAPRGEARATTRRYRPDSLVLETTLTTDDGIVRIVECMPLRGKNPTVVRVVEGISGTVPMRLDLVVRCDYGRVRPWIRRSGGRILLVAGPDALVLDSPVTMKDADHSIEADFVVRAGERIPFVLGWHPSHESPPETSDPFRAVEETDEWWRAWSSRCAEKGPHRDLVVRSLITLKALTYAPTGGILAAPTTSLPEAIGAGRNWDYRYCWLRDATFTLYSLLHTGYREEALAWRDWLLRSVADSASELQTMYGLAGERHIGERTLDWLIGYEASTPVRVGNAAAKQLQLDVYGEVVDSLHQGVRMGLPTDDAAWRLEQAICDWLESSWESADKGLWEMRTAPRHFTHSKVMAWTALDRVVKSLEARGSTTERWSALRARIHRDVCENGFDASQMSFTQSYGSKALDASLLLIGGVGFLPPTDPRIVGTVHAIERTLVRDGFVSRYTNDDGLDGNDNAFLACSFWLVDALLLGGRRADAEKLFERVIQVRNSVGLLSEEYDVARGRLVGNFPQTFSHVALVNSACSLSNANGPVQHRRGT